MKKLNRFARNLTSSTKNGKPKTALVFLNLGGPKDSSEVYPFLNRLFSDPDLIPLPFQSRLAPWIAKRRTPKIIAQYNEIGGGSPIGMWTKKQGDMVEDILNRKLANHAPFKTYIAFRYASPLTEEALQQMHDDGVERAIAFTQYPQWSCSTTGSSLNELSKQLTEVEKFKPLQSKIKWSFIDRWPIHDGLTNAFSKLIKEKLKEYPEKERSKVVLLFSAHSLPMSVVNRGDPYPQEVAATVQAVMQKLNFSNPYRLCWQSKVGPAPWLGPSTEDAIKGFAKADRKNVLMIPIAFTSDHIETLYELDLEYGEMGKDLGISGLKRCESLNDNSIFIDALGDLVEEHIKSGRKHSSQFPLRCPGCDKNSCKRTRSLFESSDGMI